MKMKLLFERGCTHDHTVLRLRHRHHEIAYAWLGLTGLQAEIEFPSDWHESRRAWVRLGLGFGKFCFSFPWAKVVPDEGQCSGPTYGFHFHSDKLWIEYGKRKGTRTDPYIAVKMPWAWRHRGTKKLGEKESHPFTYTLYSGLVQYRTATIQTEESILTRYWLPFKRVVRSINVEFDEEVGEEIGSWKGGCTGCYQSMEKGETPLQALRRIEREERF